MVLVLHSEMQPLEVILFLVRLRLQAVELAQAVTSRPLGMAVRAAVAVVKDLIPQGLAQQGKVALAVTAALELLVVVVVALEGRVQPLRAVMVVMAALELLLLFLAHLLVMLVAAAAALVIAARQA